MQLYSHHLHIVRRRARVCGFTLIELLIVIAIIALLAGMIFPITKALNRTKLRTRAKGELAQLQTAIESYKAKLGVYPPDNPGNPVTNQLYYELVGTVVTKDPQAPLATAYQTKDGGALIRAGALPAVFGLKVTGLVNAARDLGGDEASGGYNFFKTIKPNQVGLLPSGARVIASSVGWPTELPFQPIPAVRGLNPWRYNSSNPTNNPGSYDLWLDIIVDGKTNRISNWTREVLIGVP